MRFIYFAFLILLLACSISANENKTAVITAKSGLRLRKGPDLNSQKISTIPYNSVVNIIKEESNEIKIAGTTGKWTFIEWNNKKGWVFRTVKENNRDCGMP